MITPEAQDAIVVCDLATALCSLAELRTSAWQAMVERPSADLLLDIDKIDEASSLVRRAVDVLDARRQEFHVEHEVAADVTGGYAAVGAREELEVVL